MRTREGAAETNAAQPRRFRFLFSISYDLKPKIQLHRGYFRESASEPRTPSPYPGFRANLRIEGRLVEKE